MEITINEFKDENKLNYGLGLKYENFSDDDAKDNDIHLNGFARVRRGDGRSVNTNLNYLRPMAYWMKIYKTKQRNFRYFISSYLLQNGKLNLRVWKRRYPNENVDFEMIEDIPNLYVGLDEI